MTTATVPAQSELSDDELNELSHPKPSGKARLGMIASYVGMGLIVLYCIIPFYWMIVSSLRLPTEGRSTEFLPSPASVENYKGVFAGTNNFGRSLINSILLKPITRWPP